MAEEAVVEERAVEVETAVPKAPKGKRFVGFCRKCRNFVELGPTFSCMKGAHPKGDIAVALLLDKDDPLPVMPRLNVGALFMPALWGPLHGQIFTILFYPAWLFLDNMIYAAVRGTGPAWPAIAASLMLAAFTVFYALRANEVGYLRVAAEKSPEEYLAGERKQAVFLVLVAVAFIVFASWYNIAVRPTL